MLGTGSGLRRRCAGVMSCLSEWDVVGDVVRAEEDEVGWDGGLSWKGDS